MHNTQRFIIFAKTLQPTLISRQTSINMKKILLFILILPLFAISCADEIDGGYPQKVYFPKEGGAKSYTGEVGIGWFDIGDYNGSSGSKEQDDGSLVAAYGWLTVILPNDGRTTLHFITEPNTTGKTRRQSMTMNRGAPVYMKIEVIQD